MEQFEKLWAIIWPILSQVLSQLNEEDLITGVMIAFIIPLVVNALIKSILPTKVHGNFFSEIMYLVIDIVILLSPVVACYYWLKQEFPMLEELSSYLIDSEDIGDFLKLLSRVLFFCTLIFGLSRWLISKVSQVAQRIVNGFPLGYVWVVIIRVVEGILFMVTSIMLPLNGIILMREPSSTSSIVISYGKPEDVDQTIWSDVYTGVKRAQENGKSCSPYLLLSLKKYETGNYTCDSEMEDDPRPNYCASDAGAIGAFQFLPETFERNAKRYGVSGSAWNPQVAAEVACYFISDEAEISLEQSREDFIEEFSSKGFVWNADPYGAGLVYDKALSYRGSAKDFNQENNPPPQGDNADGYIWPGPSGSYVSFVWGVPMWYGKDHNGIDIVLSGFPAFEVVAIDNGQAYYWQGDSCNAGIILLVTESGEQFLYVHMELDPEKINISSETWTEVSRGEKLGWILNEKTSCSDGPHLHFMRADGSLLTEEELR